MFQLKPIIFSFFGIRDAVEDLFKDTNNKGLHQRFNELLAEDMDDNELDLINNLTENTQNPLTVFEKFLGYRELTFGVPAFDGNEAIRRKVLCFISEVNRRKGTKTGYSILLTILGYTDIVITEFLPISGFDSPVTFDDPNRHFDQRCQNCTKYSIAFDGVGALTVDQFGSILKVIEYNEPINAILESIIYNGAPVDIISVFVAPNGDLFYNNDFDLGTILTLDENGDLFVDSPKNYTVDADGDMILEILP